MIPATPTPDCVIWTGPLMPNGYPRDGRTLMHRAVLAAKLGRPLAPGMDACHTCDVRACVAQHHLYEGTRAQNMREAVERRRAYNPSGEKHPCARVTDAQVVEMRALAATGSTDDQLAEKYGLRPRYVHEVIRGRRRQLAASATTPSQENP
jgi:hypothetical protein